MKVRCEQTEHFNITCVHFTQSPTSALLSLSSEAAVLSAGCLCWQREQQVY